MTQNPTVLVVDDELGPRESLRMILKDTYKVVAIDDPKKALDSLAQESVDVIISDIKMGEMDGIEFLRNVKSFNKEVEVIMITAYPDSDTTISALRYGAFDYILKPFNHLDILSTVNNAVLKRSAAIRERKIIDDLRSSIQRNYKATTDALILAIDAKDSHTYGHSKRVAALFFKIAKELNLGEQEQNLLGQIALLHDIGKIGVSEYILRKPGPLTQEEYQQMKQHPALGYNILQPVEFLKEGLNVILHFHERIDGRGYPDGLKGNEIPFGARLLTIIDAYDAMTSDRPYRKSFAHEEALKELERCSGTQFDPELAKIFLEFMAREEANKSNS